MMASDITMTPAERNHRIEVLGLLIDENNATRKTLHGLFRAGTIETEVYETLLAGLDALVAPYHAELRTLLDSIRINRNPEGLD